MKFNFFLLFCLFIVPLQSQEKEIIFIGKTLFNNLEINDVHIINKRTKKGVITNTKGFFEINLKVGDSLFFSHINLKDKTIIISKDIIHHKNYQINLQENTYALDGFVLEKQRSIFYKDPSIKTYNGPLVNAKTLNLPYANTKAAADKNTIVTVESGAVVSLEKLIGALNGNNKRKEILEQFKYEDARLEKIRKYFTDDFFITDLRIRQKNINPFLNYCLSKNIIHVFEKEDIFKVIKILTDQSKTFPQKVNSEILLARKKDSF